MAGKNEAKIKFTADTAEFNEQITQANSAMTGLRAEMKLNDAQFKNTGDSAEYLKQKQQLLQSELEANEQKQQALNGKLEAAKTIYGENSQEAQKWATKLTYAKTEQAKLEGAISETNSELNGFNSTADSAESEMSQLGNAAKGAGESVDTVNVSFGSMVKGKLVDMAGDAIMNLGSKAIDAGKKLIQLGVDAASYADNILTASQVTGMSTDELQEYQYASELIDTSLDTVTGSMKKNLKSMMQAQKGSEDYTAAYEKLGVSVTDANGNLRNSEDVFWDCIDALGGVSDETERDAIAMQIFGKSANELNPLIIKGSDGFKQLAQQAQDAGAVLSGDTLDSLGGVDDSIQYLKQNSEAFGRAIGTKVAPMIGFLADAASDALIGLTNFVEGADLSPLEQQIKDAKTEADKFKKTLDETGENWDTAFSDAETIESLGNRLMQLNSISDPTLDQSFQMRTIVQELSQYIPELADAYDEETGKLKMTNKELREYVTNCEAQMLVKAKEQASQKIINGLLEQEGSLRKAQEAQSVAQHKVDAINNQIDGMTNLWNQYEKLNEQEQQAFYLGQDTTAIGEKKAKVAERLSTIYGVAAGSADSFTSAQSRLADQATEANGNLDAANKVVSENKSNVDQANEKLKEMKEDLIAAAQTMGFSQETIDQLTATLDKDTDGIISNNKAQQEAAENAKAAADAYKTASDAMEQAFTSAVESAKSAFSINPFDKWEQDSEKGLSAFMEAMQSQEEGMKNYQANIDVLTDNLGQRAPEFLNYLEQMGPEGAQLVQELADAVTSGDMKTVNDAMYQFLSATDQQQELSANLAADAVAYKLGLGEIGSSDAEYQELQNSITNGFTKADEATKSSVAQLAASAQAMGVTIPSGLAEGISSETIQPEQATQQLTSAMFGQLNGLVTAAQKAGISLPQSLVDGINAKTVDPVQAFNELVKSINGSSVDTSGAKAAGEATGSAMTKSMTDDASKGASEAASTAISELSKGISSQASTVTGTVSDMMANVRTMLTTGTKAMAPAISSSLDRVTDEFSDMASDVRRSMSQAETSVIVGVGKLRSALNTKLKGPDIAVPHFSMSGDFNAKTKQVPSVSVQWYAKGAVFDNATIIPTLYGLKGVGEAGPEAVAPVDVLQNYVAAAVMQSVPQIDYDLLGEKVAEAVSRMDMAIEMDGREFGRAVRRVSG